MPFDPIAWLAEELAAWEERGLRRQPVVRSGTQGGAIQVAGENLLNFGSNDYLGLAADPRVCQRVSEAVAQVGFGAGASPLVTGRGALHRQLEEALAAFEQTAAAILFPTGFAANLGTVAALAGPGDCIFSDAKNHASLIDGCRLSGAETIVYRHADAEQLGELLAKTKCQRRRLIVTDSLFSMDGDFAPLPELANLAAEFQALLLVDEAHATGVFGSQGRGLCEAFDVESPSVIRVGTLSKALGSAGGFVAGSQVVIEWLRNRARPYMFSTALPEATAAAALAALEIVRTEPNRRQQLLELAAWLREQLRTLGWNVGQSASQIIPVIIGDPEPTMRLAAKLRSAGIFVPGIRPPSVPAGESLLRISLTASHTRDHCEKLLASLGRPG